MQEGLVFDIKKFSIHDGPGIRTTVFLKGCPLVCAWCHNPEGQSSSPQILLRPERCLVCGSCEEVCPEGALNFALNKFVTDTTKCSHCGNCAEVCPSEARELVGRKMSLEEVIGEIEKDQLFYEESGGGATFSGGEPLMQPDFLLALLRECGRNGIHRVVDTSGLAAEELLVEVAAETDLFLYDLKHLDDERHRAYTGVSNSIILRNLRMLVSTDAPVNIRIPMIGGFNDDESSVLATADWLKTLPRTCKVSLLPFHNGAEEKHRRFGMTYRVSDSPEVGEERMQEICRLFSSLGLEVRIGG